MSTAVISRIALQKLFAPLPIDTSIGAVGGIKTLTLPSALNRIGFTKISPDANVGAYVTEGTDTMAEPTIQLDMQGATQMFNKIDGIWYRE